MEYLKKLNKEQREAAVHTDGPLLILAGAGSGKTGTMTHRIAYLIREVGVNPYNILAVTFTNKAAEEMRIRVETILDAPTNMWIMTFHAACLRMLRKYGDRLGYSSNFAVYDPVDAKAVIKLAMKEIKVDDKQFTVAGLLNSINKCKEAQQTPKDFIDDQGGEQTADYRSSIVYKVYEFYDKMLLKNNAMDFDDLLLNAVRLLKKNADVLDEYAGRFRYIMVDEYQDTNGIQYEFIKLLAGGHGNLCVVGDDDQCIYQWRGADITNILNFERDFSGTKVIKLEQNYRSTGNILSAAHSVIEKNRGRKSKRLWTEAETGRKITYRRAENEKEEAFFVAQEIDRLHGSDRGYKSFAVLYRANAQSRNFEEALSARDIPYRVVGGVRYYDRKEIKDMVAYMRLVQNPDDDLALLRVINEPKRGIGLKTQEKLRAYAQVRGESIFNLLKDEAVTEELPKKAMKPVVNMIDVITSLSDELENLRVSDIYDSLLNGTGYMEALESAGTTEADGRLENLLEFRSVIYDHEEEGRIELDEFLEKIAIMSDIDNQNVSEDAAVLMTMHSAKGLEFPVVFLTGMEDGTFPSWRSIDEKEKLEEERRLCYVGMTRAMERLYLTGAEYRVMYGKGSYTRESTFLREIDPKLLEGDGVYVKKNEIKLGESKPFDGYGEPPDPEIFDALKKAKRELKERRVNTENFQVGNVVEHGKFGRGTVIESKGKIITVMFENEGVKKLAGDRAPIHIVKE